jgi:uncharacterized protein
VVEKLGIKEFDILPPDATHSDNPPQISDYFIKLFDVWYDKYAAKGVRIRTLDAMIQGLVGNFSVSDTVGLGPIETVTLMTDGSLEPLDVLRIVGDGSTKTNSSVLNNALQDVQNDPRWREAFEASMELCETCQKCEFLDSCGGVMWRTGGHPSVDSTIPVSTATVGRASSVISGNGFLRR